MSTTAPTLDRPAGFQNRDLLAGTIACTAVAMKRPAGLEYASKLCEALFGDYPAPANWYPALDTEHALAVITYAGKALKIGAFTKPEYDYVTDKARRSILHVCA